MTGFRTGFVAAGLLLAVAGTATAADLNGPRVSLKDSEVAAPYRACSGDRFRGFYAGATLGMMGYNNRWQEDFADFTDYQDAPLKTTHTGVAGGLGLGYNFVRCNVLFGLEGDVNFANSSGATNHFPTNPAAATGYARISDSLRDFMTLRGRMGFVADRTLFYATGGLAWAKLHHRLEDMDHFNGGNPIPEPNFSNWKAGWTIGGGFETALTEMVSLKAEALYMDFGKRSYEFADSAAPPDIYAFTTRHSAVTVRIGLNIKLGAPPSHATASSSDECPASVCPKK